MSKVWVPLIVMGVMGSALTAWAQAGGNGATVPAVEKLRVKIGLLQIGYESMTIEEKAIDEKDAQKLLPTRKY